MMAEAQSLTLVVFALLLSIGIAILFLFHVLHLAGMCFFFVGAKRDGKRENRVVALNCAQ